MTVWQTKLWHTHEAEKKRRETEMAAKKGGLGKGFDVIFAENDMEDPNSVVVRD